MEAHEIEPGMNFLDNPSHRKRIVRKGDLMPALVDPLAFKKNKSTEQAQLLCSTMNSFESEIHIDKHYHIRHQQGDQNGKRDGIEPEVVEKLVKKSIKYLVAFSSMFNSFKFVNYENQPEKPVRVVLMEEINGNTLNVVIMAHFIEANKLEITIKTAMSVEDFRVESGQFAVVIDDIGATLKKWVNNNLQEVYVI